MKNLDKEVRRRWVKFSQKIVSRPPPLALCADITRLWGMDSKIILPKKRPHLPLPRPQRKRQPQRSTDFAVSTPSQAHPGQGWN
jgi:hypothetical protein